MHEASKTSRVETIETKPFFFDAERTRCLIPVSGYREWQTLQTGNSLDTSLHLFPRCGSVKYDQGLVFHVITLAPLSVAFVPGSKTHGIPADTSMLFGRCRQ